MIKKIVLENINNFEGKREFYFDKYNLVTGSNGAGKSTLSLYGILFCLYGHLDKPLAQWPNKNKKECSVIIEIENNNNQYIIERKYPTNIQIIKNGIKIDLADNNEKQKWITKEFGDLDTFRKFKILDSKQSFNVLEQGKTALKKTLLNFNEDLFLRVKQNLLTKKKEREIYNKDNLKTYIHFPSLKRLETLKNKLNEIDKILFKTDKEINTEDSILMEETSKRAKAENNKNTQKDLKNKIFYNNKCPTCGNLLEEKIKNNLLKEISNRITEIDSFLSIIISDLELQKDLVLHLKEIKNKMYFKKQTISNWLIKLEGRLKQSDYKYSTKDVEIIKACIDEVDSFSSYYLLEYVKILEPIINNIVQNIGFSIKFIVNKKADIEINLKRNNQDFKYDDLSTGERLILSLSFQLAVLFERGETGTIIADEGFGNLDNTNLLMILELFKNLPFQLIAVIHRIENVPDGINVIKL